MSTSKRVEAPPPPVDERLVMPGVRYEIIDGGVEYVGSADPLHASRHSVLPLRALVDAAKADDAVAAALLAKGNPILDSALSAAEGRGEQRGLFAGKIAALLAVLSARKVKLGKKAVARIRAEQREAVTDVWLTPAATCVSADELLRD